MVFTLEWSLRRDDMMRVFISQPMHGLSNEEILQRREELIRLLHKWFQPEPIEVIDSYTKPENIVNGGRIVMLGHSIQMLSQADAVLFARGWSDSPGCIVEHTVCEQYKIKTLYEDNIPIHLKEDLDFYNYMNQYMPINEDTQYWR